MRFFIVIFDINKSLITNLLNAMRNLLPLFVVMALFGCGNKPVKPAWSAGENRHPAYYIYLDPNDTIETVEQVKDNSKSLNDIRFGDWTEEDWRDNDYFRALRKYLDACCQGKIVDKNLEPYKSVLKGRFVIFNAEPCISGGMFVSIIFLEAPNKIFDVVIYSDVDEDTETIVDYHVRGVIPREDEESGLTKNDILTIIKEHPENKLW